MKVVRSTLERERITSGSSCPSEKRVLVVRDLLRMTLGVNWVGCHWELFPLSSGGVSALRWPGVPEVGTRSSECAGG